MSTLENLIKEERQGIEGVVDRMEEEIITPYELKAKYPLNGAEKTVIDSRRDVANIISGDDERLLVVLGPCSIDNFDAAVEYAERLKVLSEELSDKMYLVMRTYFEKPRTTVGWKGMINDPDQNETFDFNKGLEVSRRLLIHLAERGVACATEFLNKEVCDYIGDLISYGAIGARNTSSQTNREFASGLLMPVGFKNSTEGNVQLAVDAVIASMSPQSYLDINDNGRLVRRHSQGNKYSHVILRGGESGPNYDSESVKRAVELLKKNNITNHLFIDCSHANSSKDYNRQLDVAMDVVRQKKTNPYIVGIMLESYLFDGKGKEYGQSKTDSCIGLEKTEKLLRGIYNEIMVVN